MLHVAEAANRSNSLEPQAHAQPVGSVRLKSSVCRQAALSAVRQYAING
jgi:hypothetical protein